MARYYVNKNAQAGSGDHEVHKSGCAFMPLKRNRIYLGDYLSCHSALAAARLYYDDVDGCYFCSNACHTG